MGRLRQPSARRAIFGRRRSNLDLSFLGCILSMICHKNLVPEESMTARRKMVSWLHSAHLAHYPSPLH